MTSTRSLDHGGEAQQWSDSGPLLQISQASLKTESIITACTRHPSDSFICPRMDGRSRSRSPCTTLPTENVTWQSLPRLSP